MNRYPFYMYYLRSTLALYEIIARIDSIVSMTDKELCPKNKCLAVCIILKKMENDMQDIERKLLCEEMTFLESEVKECEQNVSALNFRFTINLN